jgi:hypothetical protein
MAAPAATSEAPPPEPPLPGGLGSLGEPCPDPVPENLRCGNAGRVSGVYADAFAYGSRPPGAEALYERHSSDEQRSALLISFDGPTVWLQVLQCGGCRTLVGWTFVGHPADLTDDQLLEVARRAKLPDGPALRSRIEWAEAPWDAAFEAIPKGMHEDGAVAPPREPAPSPPPSPPKSGSPAKTPGPPKSEDAPPSPRLSDPLYEAN